MAHDCVFDDDEMRSELEDLAILHAAQMALARRGLPPDLARGGPTAGEAPIFEGTIDWGHRGVHAAAMAAGFTDGEWDFLDPFTKAALIGGEDGSTAAAVGISSECPRRAEFAPKLGKMSALLSSVLQAALSETEAAMESILNNRE